MRRVTSMAVCMVALACAAEPKAPASADARASGARAIDPHVQYRLAQDFEQRERIDDAFTAYGDAVRLSNGSHKPALFGVARLADKLGRKDDVADACQHFIDGSPDDELGDARTWCVSHLAPHRR